MKVFFSYYLPVIAWMGLIFILSSRQDLPSPQLAWLDFLIKKTAHMVVFGILYVLYFRVVFFHTKKKQWLFPFLLTIAYAITDELHQSLTPGRTATLRDVGYDGLGAMVAALRIYGFV